MTSLRPYQYIKGWVEFYKLKFKVTSDVLIPRPETELLVDEVIRLLADHPERLKGVEGSIIILDIGTGSGNIAISIAKNLPNSKIIATDISLKALNLAKQNAKLHGVEKRIKFIISNLLENPIIHNTNYKKLIIVANLPYIPTARISYLAPSVKDFEPKIALDGGKDGFELYRKLFRQIKQKFIKNSPGADVIHPPGVFVVCEIDYSHGELALKEAQNYFPNAQIEVKTDLSHKQRILTIQPVAPPM